MEPLAGEHKDVRFAKFTPAPDLDAVTLREQDHITEIKLKPNGMPHATLDGKNVWFGGAAKKLEQSLSPNPTVLERQELAIWRLCSIFFDQAEGALAPITTRLPPGVGGKYEDRMRMDIFSEFLASVVAPQVADGLKVVKTPEEKAILLLTQNDVSGACEVLLANRDFRLATLVSQLPASSASNPPTVAKQIEAWQQRKDWSEMSDAVRALYSILAGNFYIVPGAGEGKIAAEDQVEEFCLSQRFNLSWQQSLALRVLYGGHKTLEAAIKAYREDLNREDSKEVFVESVWFARTGETRFEHLDDTLYQLCCLYVKDGKLGELLDPLSVSGSAVSSRLAWQLAALLTVRKAATVDDAMWEKLTLDFASELETAGRLVQSAKIFLHLRDDAARHRAITGLLFRNADKMSDPPVRDEQNTFALLTEHLHIPKSIVFAAKAQYAKAIGDPLAQARWLLHAGHNDEAHEVLCSTVGPQAVIEQDYVGLAQLVRDFDGRALGQPQRRPRGWEHGGQVYEALVQLLGLKAGQKYGGEGERLLQVLRKGLDGMEADASTGKVLEKRVALQEMSRMVEEWEREIEGVDERALVAAAGGADEAGEAASGKGDGVALWERYRRGLGVVV
jgi:nuclear pore complex protein Nup98-Nup96